MPAIPAITPTATEPESFISRNRTTLLTLTIALGMLLMLVVGLFLGGLGVYLYFNSSKLIETTQKPALPRENSPSRPTRLGPGPESQKYLDQGNENLKNGRFRDAEENFREAVRLSPNNANCLIHLGSSLFHQGKFSEAKDTFQHVTQLPAEKFYLNYAYSYMGRIEWERGYYSLATTSFERAVELAPNDFGSMACLGFVQKLAGNTSEAETNLKKVLAGSNDEELRKIVQKVLDGAQPPTTATDAGLGPGR
jgi:tetratricopeptide (TPR) repeat protein